MAKTRKPKARRARANVVEQTAERATPVPLSDKRKAELRARAEALAAEYSAPLPDGDAGLIEAERRHREIRQQTRSLYREFFKIDAQTEKEIIIEIIDPVRYRLSDFIEQTRPAGLAGAAVKLRLLTDEDIGIVIGEPSEGDIMSLKQVAEFVEVEAGVASNPEVVAPASIIKEAYQIKRPTRSSMIWRTISKTPASLPMGLPSWPRTRSTMIQSWAQCLCGTAGRSLMIARRSKRGAASCSGCCTQTATILRKKGGRATTGSMRSSR